MSELSHVEESGDVHMVDIGSKPLSRRRAVARAVVRMAPETARRLRELPKGDALATAQLAGIMAAKRTSELIPLCHPLPLSHVEVALEVGDGAVAIVASAETVGQTGVEMEALTAASVAALTVYDMAKAIDKEMQIAEVVLVSKTKETVGWRPRVSRSYGASCPTSVHRSPTPSARSRRPRGSCSRPAGPGWRRATSRPRRRATCWSARHPASSTLFVPTRSRRRRT